MTIARRPIASIAQVDGLQGALSDTRVLSRGFDAFGFFSKPADFTPTLPCHFYRDAAGDIQHDMDFTQYTGGTVLEVNTATGSDITGDGSSGAPYKTISKAAQVAAAGGDAAYCIKLKSDAALSRDQFWLAGASGITFTDKTIAIIPDNTTGRILAYAYQTALTWSADNNVWKASRSSVRGVYDTGVVDANGIPIPYTGVASLAACKATSSTWYTDGTYVYVNTATGVQPVDGTHLVAVTQALKANLLGTSKLYFENVTLIGANSAAGFTVYGDSTGASVVGEFCANGCKFIGGNLLYSASTSAGDVIDFIDVENVYLFDSIAAYGRRDGFNFHYTDVPEEHRRDCLAVIVGCESYSNGLIDAGTTNNNAFTSHEGANILMLDCSGYTTQGPVLACVNGCYTIALDCNMRDSTTSNAAYYMTTDTPPSGITGKTILVNCTHDDETLSTADLYVDATMDCYLIGSDLTPATGSSVPTTVR